MNQIHVRFQISIDDWHDLVAGNTLVDFRNKVWTVTSTADLDTSGIIEIRSDGYECSVRVQTVSGRVRLVGNYPQVALALEQTPASQPRERLVTSQGAL